MADSEKEKRIAALIARVNEDIQRWRKIHSQSDPGAASEIRELRSELAALEKIQKDLLRSQKKQHSS